MLTPIELIKATVDAGDRAEVRPHREHHVVGSEGAHRHPRTLQRRALGAHRFRRRAGAQGRLPQRHDQQSVARLVRHRPPADDDGRTRQGGRQVAGRGDARGSRGRSGGALRPARRVRCRLRVPLQRSCRLHRRPEHPAATAVPTRARSDITEETDGSAAQHIQACHSRRSATDRAVVEPVVEIHGGTDRRGRLRLGAARHRALAQRVPESVQTQLRPSPAPRRRRSCARPGTTWC